MLAACVDALIKAGPRPSITMAVTHGLPLPGTREMQALVLAMDAGSVDALAVFRRVQSCADVRDRRAQVPAIDQNRDGEQQSDAEGFGPDRGGWAAAA